MSLNVAPSSALDRAKLIDWYRRNRTRSRALFDLLADDAYYSRPIDLRHPIVFYDGHLPAFSFNTLVKKALGRPSIDPQLEQLFARGIDPGEADTRLEASHGWPERSVVEDFSEEADRRVLESLQRDELVRSGDPMLDGAEAVFAILEHEAMHQETLLYMWHQLPFQQKSAPAGYVPHTAGQVRADQWVDVPFGSASLGVDRGTIPFGWDNEFPAHRMDVEPFSMQRGAVTNAAFLEFVEAGGYTQAQWWRPEDWAWVQKEAIAHPLFWQGRNGSWLWRGMFEWIPLPLSWPVYVSFAEAAAFARWKGGRLPTEAEFQRAAYGTPEGRERTHPWGDAEPTSVHGVFDFTSWDPEPAGSHPEGASAWGIDDLVGNGWQWTQTPFAPFSGFRPMASYPEYSADFFDGDHFVMKGASPATARELLRPTFRNWFRPRYPYVYAAFRCVRNAR